MLSVLNSKSRWKATVALALMYALCVIAPSAALAFADRDATAHCLTEPHSHAATHRHGDPAQKHADAIPHVHDHQGTPGHSPSNDKGQAGKCCGLFCVTALASASVPELGKPALASTLFPAADTGLASRGPDRINRPPIA